jgi:hypothetical protein
VYFPFEPPDKRDLRPTQAYLAKLPAAVVQLIPSLAASVGLRRLSVDSSEQLPHLGAAYRAADEAVAISARDPFTVDPALVERANCGHAATQNKLAFLDVQFIVNLEGNE